MESGPRRMYAQQAPAFEARSRMVRDLGPSTQDSPPVFTFPDIEGLTALKKQVVENLPTKCVHCEADMLPEYCTELRDGTVMAYCKKKDACGRSLVLFAGVKLVHPFYRQICPFESAPRPAATIPEPAEMQATPQMQTQQEHGQHQEVSPVREESKRARHARGQIDIYEMHGIHRPDEVCQRCQKTYDEHEHVDCDKFGWVRDHVDTIELPAHWPTYDRRTHTWRPRSSIESI